ncbi:hypothetical protein M0805_009189 [Coniferiporia weirii]|nr:hypothetical protein M0805_009189 [Coniferiporia weirii]
MALLGWQSPRRSVSPMPPRSSALSTRGDNRVDRSPSWLDPFAPSPKLPHLALLDDSPRREGISLGPATHRINDSIVFDLSGPRSQSPMAFRSTTMHERDNNIAALGFLGGFKGDKNSADNPQPLTGYDQIYVSNIAPQDTSKRDFRFWMCIVALMMASFLIVLDLSGLGTALPTIVNDLHGTEFEWVGSAYALASTALLPLTGALAQVFGRKSVMLTQIFMFALGSALCGAAKSMNSLIGGRTLQGIGAGGIASLTQIVISDLVPLQERGTFNGLIAL